MREILAILCLCKIKEWFGLEGTSKIISFQLPWAGTPSTRASIQPGLASLHIYYILTSELTLQMADCNYFSKETWEIHQISIPLPLQVYRWILKEKAPSCQNTHQSLICHLKKSETDISLGTNGKKKRKKKGEPNIWGSILGVISSLFSLAAFTHCLFLLLFSQTAYTHLPVPLVIRAACKAPSKKKIKCQLKTKKERKKN